MGLSFSLVRECTNPLFNRPYSLGRGRDGGEIVCTAKTRELEETLKKETVRLTV